MNINPVEVIVTVIALVLLMSPLMLWAYLAGRRASATGKTHRFDRVTAEIHLNDTWWQAEFDADEETVAAPVMRLHLQQVGSRVFGEATSFLGTRHFFEGMLHGRQLCYISLDDNQRAEWAGAVLAEVLPGENRIVGIRTRWAEPQCAMLMRKVTFTRLNGADSAISPNVNS